MAFLASSAVGLFGALEVAQRQYDLMWEVQDYLKSLKSHPKAAVVNLGCGLDDTFRKVDNGICRSFNIDMPDVIAVRNELLPQGIWVISLCLYQKLSPAACGETSLRNEPFRAGYSRKNRL